MSRPVRNRLDLDYSILHRTGRRVPKVRDSKMDDLRIQAINISSDVDDLFDSYEISELAEMDDLEDYVRKIGDVKREYRRIHRQIKDLDGDGFPTRYPDFDKQKVN